MFIHTNIILSDATDLNPALIKKNLKFVFKGENAIEGISLSY